MTGCLGMVQNFIREVSNLFFERVIRHWNGLPREVITVVRQLVVVCPFKLFFPFISLFFFFLVYSILRSYEEQFWGLIEKDFGSESLETMRPDQIACHSIWVQESHGCFREGIGLWAGHLHRQCHH